MTSGAKSGSANASAVGVLHDTLVLNRRVNILAGWFAELLPAGVRVLDVGCGDGLISATVCAKRPDIKVQGIDVLPRAHAHIPVQLFDGVRLPFNDGSFDVVLFSDVLHHTADPLILLREARRVTARHVLIKDHYRKGVMARQRLRFMDWVGNARFGVALPYNYWAEQQWHNAWQEIGLKPESVLCELGLYPWPVNWAFGAGLHYIALLRKV